MGDYIDIVFDGPPSHESGRFLEVENSNGESINFGEWVCRSDGYWVLRILNLPGRDELARLIHNVRNYYLGFACEDNLHNYEFKQADAITEFLFGKNFINKENNLKETLGKAMDKAEQKMQAENVKPRPNCGPQNTIGVVPPKSNTRTFSTGESCNITNDLKLRECAQALVDKLNLIKQDQGYNSVFTIAHMHGCPYTGPNHVQELENLEKLLNESLCS